MWGRCRKKIQGRGPIAAPVNYLTSCAAAMKPGWEQRDELVSQCKLEGIGAFRRGQEAEERGHGAEVA